MTTPAAPEKAPLSPGSAEVQKVVQPLPVGKVPGLQDFLEAMNSLELGNVGETMGEDTSAHDAGSGAGFARGGTAGGTMTARELAIANLPPPSVMQRQLEKHIKTEVKKLRRQARRVAHIHGPGAAYHLNRLYARIRQFHTLLNALLEASVEVVKRFFIRVFIDRQPIL